MINQFDDVNSFNYSFSKASGCVGVIGRSGPAKGGGRASSLLCEGPSPQN